MSLTSFLKPCEAAPATVRVFYERKNSLNFSDYMARDLRLWLQELLDLGATISSLIYYLPDGSYFEITPLSHDADGLPYMGVIRRCWSPDCDWLAAISELQRTQDRVKVIIPV